MKKVSLSGSLREGVGTKDAKLMRQQDLIPCVMYGGEVQKHFAVNRLELNKLIYTPDVYEVELDLEGEKFSTILKDVQFHPVSDKPLHADFMQMIEGKKLKIEIPVRLEGNAIGVLNGGRLMQNFRKMKVKAFPNELPDIITIDIAKLRIGQKIRVSDVEGKYESLEFLHPSQAVVVGIKTARGAVDEDEEDDNDEEGAEEGAENKEAAEAEA